MPIFQYKAKNKAGETVQGKVEAVELEQAHDVLQNRGLFVVSVRPAGEGDLAAMNVFAKIKRDDIVNFTRQLATMVTAGLSLLDAMTILQRQSKPAMQKLTGELAREVESGSSFASALAQHEEFDRIYVNLIKAGEAAGVLSEVMQRLADNLEKEKEFRGKVKGALIYPVIVLIAMAIVGTIMMIFVVPQLADLYRDFGADLPIMTQILIGFSELLTHSWFIMIPGFAAAIFAFRAWRKTPLGARKYDGFILKLPVFGELIQKITLTEFARTLSLLLGAGISLLESLEIVRDAINNVIYREALQDAYNMVEKGNSLAVAIEKYDVFPVILPQMIAVGEETGQLDEVLMKLSKYFESETEQAVKSLTTALEPIIMIVLGIGVGFLIISIVMPIYSLTSQF